MWWPLSTVQFVLYKVVEGWKNSTGKHTAHSHSDEINVSYDASLYNSVELTESL